MASYRNLRKHNILTEILCVVHAGNINYPLEVYRFFKEIGARFITFLPLVIRDENNKRGVNELSVTAEGFGNFMITVFDEWVNRDIGNIKNNSLLQLLNSSKQRDFGKAKRDTLPRYCLECEVLTMCNGECPKNRFIHIPDGEPGHV